MEEPLGWRSEGLQFSRRGRDVAITATCGVCVGENMSCTCVRVTVSAAGVSEAVV